MKKKIFNQNNFVKRRKYSFIKGLMFITILISLSVLNGCFSKTKPYIETTNSDIDKNTNSIVKIEPEETALKKASNSQELVSALKPYTILGKYAQKEVTNVDVDEINDSFLKTGYPNAGIIASVNAEYITDMELVLVTVHKFSTEKEASNFFDQMNTGMIEIFNHYYKQMKNTTVSSKVDNNSVILNIKENGKKKKVIFTTERENRMETLTIRGVDGISLLKRKSNFFFMTSGGEISEDEIEDNIKQQSKIISAFLEDI